MPIKRFFFYVQLYEIVDVYNRFEKFSNLNLIKQTTVTLLTLGDRLSVRTEETSYTLSIRSLESGLSTHHTSSTGLTVTLLARHRFNTVLGAQPRNFAGWRWY